MNREQILKAHELLFELEYIENAISTDMDIQINFRYQGGFSLDGRYNADEHLNGVVKNAAKIAEEMILEAIREKRDRINAELAELGVEGHRRGPEPVTKSIVGWEPSTDGQYELPRYS